jgi:hypothetical protein
LNSVEKIIDLLWCYVPSIFFFIKVNVGCS